MMYPITARLIGLSSFRFGGRAGWYVGVVGSDQGLLEVQMRPSVRSILPSNFAPPNGCPPDATGMSRDPDYCRTQAMLNGKVIGRERNHIEARKAAALQIHSRTNHWKRYEKQQEKPAAPRKYQTPFQPVGCSPAAVHHRKANQMESPLKQLNHYTKS